MFFHTNKKGFVGLSPSVLGSPLHWDKLENVIVTVNSWKECTKQGGKPLKSEEHSVSSKSPSRVPDERVAGRNKREQYHPHSGVIDLPSRQINDFFLQSANIYNLSFWPDLRLP